MAEQQEMHKNMSVATSTIIKIVVVFLALYFFYLIRDVILLLVVSMILSSALTPLVEKLYARLRFPRGLTVVLVYLLFIGLVVLIVSIVVPRLISEVANLGISLEGIRGQFAEGSALMEFLDQFGLQTSLENIGNYLASITEDAVKTTLGVFSGVFSFITVLVISFYLVIEQNALKDFAKSVTPAKYHERINSTVQKVQARLGSWLLGMVTLMFSIFLLTYIGLSILGVNNALALALFAGLLEIVPYLGPLVSLIPAAFVALFESPLLAILVIILYIAVQQFENYVLVPRIIGRRIGANPLVVLIALLIGFRLAGIIGMLIAAPLVAIMTVVLQDYREHKKPQAETT